MITLYSATETTFNHNGLGALTPKSCIISEEINSTYELELVHPFDERGAWAMLKEGTIIKANAPIRKRHKLTLLYQLAAERFGK